MSSQRWTCSTRALTVGADAGAPSARTPSATVSPASSAAARASCPSAPTSDEVDGQADRAGAAEQRQGCVGGTAVDPRLGTGVADGARAPRPAPRSPRAGARCGAGRTRRRSAPHRRGRRAGRARRPGRRSGSRRQATSYVGDVVGHAQRQRLGQVASGAVVGQHLVAARPLDGRGQRPRAGDLHLERAGSGRRPAPRARRGPGRAGCGRGAGRPAARRTCPVSRQPAGCRSASSSVTSPRARPTIPARTPRPGTSGRNGQVELTEHQPQRLVEVALVGPREGADAGCEGHAGHAASVASIVAEPTTRLPW